MLRIYDVPSELGILPHLRVNLLFQSFVFLALHFIPHFKFPKLDIEGINLTDKILMLILIHGPKFLYFLNPKLCGMFPKTFLIMSLGPEIWHMIILLLKLLISSVLID